MLSEIVLSPFQSYTVGYGITPGAGMPYSGNVFGESVCLLPAAGGGTVCRGCGCGGGIRPAAGCLSGTCGVTPALTSTVTLVIISREPAFPPPCRSEQRQQGQRYSAATPSQPGGMLNPCRAGETSSRGPITLDHIHAAPGDTDKRPAT